MRPCRAAFGQMPVDRVLTDPGATGAPADEDALGVAAGAIEDFRADRLVVEDDIGALQCLQRPQGQQIGVARAGADQKDRPGMVLPIVGPLAGAREGGLGFVPAAGERRRADRSIDDALPELPQRDRAAPLPRGGGPKTTHQSREVADARRQQRFDALP